MARTTPTWKLVGLAGAVAGLAVTGGVRLTGRRLRSVTDPALDDPLAPPTDVVHHRLPTDDGGSLHVVDTGTAADGGTRPVLLMHGVTLQWWVWSAAIALLRRHYRVLAWDMRGHGESTAGTDGATLEGAARDVERLVRELDLDDVILVGHSMGGMVIGRVAADQHAFLHDRVAGLVFVATSAAPMAQAAIVGGLSALAGLAGRLAAHSVRRPRFSYPWHEGDLSAVLVATAFGRNPTARMLDDLRRMEMEMSNAAVAEAAASIATHDVRHDLAMVDLPTSIVVGTHDRLTPVIHSRELNQLIRASELEVLPGIGHQVMQEHPAAILDAVHRVVGRAGETPAG